MRGHETDPHALLGAQVVRTWRTEIDPSHADEYDDFARTKSLRMFRAQPGFRAVLFSSYGVVRLVVTFWQDRESVEALQSSPTYAATVNEIEGSGFLRGNQTVEAFDIDIMFSHVENTML
jgi:heme-degrading monooxygenase HmoA